MHCSFRDRITRSTMSFSLPAMRRDELLFQPVASYQGCEASDGKDQAIVRAKQKRFRHSAHSSVSGDQGLLGRSLSGLGLARSRQMPAQTRQRSIAQRSSGAMATDGIACTLGLKPTGHFLTCQPRSWKTR